MRLFWRIGNEEPALMDLAQANQTERTCPWCGSAETRLIVRGYTGPTDETDQYFRCERCDKVTYELVAKTAREMRLGRFHTGGIYQDRVNHTRYHVSRVLKVGLNEYLVYLKPILASELAASSP